MVPARPTRRSVSRGACRRNLPWPNQATSTALTNARVVWCGTCQVSGWQGARDLHSQGGSAIAYKGMVDCFVRTVREEGVQALFKVCCCDEMNACVVRGMIFWVGRSPACCDGIDRCPDSKEE
jgi:hypothetical protein